MIRSYSDDDYDGVAGVWRQCFSGKLRPIDSKEHLHGLVERGPGLFLVAEENGEIIGSVFAGYDGRQATIHRLSVLPEYRRKGIGGELMAELMKRLEAMRPIEVLAHADPEPYVIEIYDKLGLKKSDAVYMKKKVY